MSCVCCHVDLSAAFLLWSFVGAHVCLFGRAGTWLLVVDCVLGVFVCLHVLIILDISHAGGSAFASLCLHVCILVELGHLIHLYHLFFVAFSLRSCLVVRVARARYVRARGPPVVQHML